MRSFTDPPGFSISSLARTVGRTPRVTERSRTRGVFAHRVEERVQHLHRPTPLRRVDGYRAMRRDGRPGSASDARDRSPDTLHLGGKVPIPRADHARDARGAKTRIEGRDRESTGRSTTASTRAGGIGGGESLLVVDDDPFIARLLEIELRAAGYDVRVAADGAHGPRRGAGTLPRPGAWPT